MQRGRGSGDSRGGRGDFRGGSRGGRGRGGPPPPQDYRGGSSPSRGFEGRGGRGGPQRGGRGRGGPPASTGPLIFSPGGEALINSQDRTAEDSLVQRFKTMNIQTEELQPVLRPGYGTKGSAIVVRSNYFQITRGPPTLYEYKIYYQPDARNKRIRRRILQILEDSPAFQPYKDHLAHDGSEKLISTKKLPAPNQNPLELKVKFFDEDEQPDNKSKIYTLSFSFTGELTKQEIDNHLQGVERQNVAPYIAALNILAAKEAGKNGIRVGGDRYFFKSAGPSFDLKGGIEAWKGFYSSVRPTLNSLMINVNVCYTAFYKTGKLSDAIETFQQASFFADPSRFVDGLRVQVTHLSYRPKKTIYRLAKPATECTFQCQEYGGSITVQKYFLRKYNIQLQKPRWVVDVGKAKDPRYVPAELLEILPDQPFRGKLLDTHTAEMIKFACRKPADNARSIMNEGLPSLGFNQAVKRLGIDISTEMAVVPARVLSPPTVVYNGGRNARINNDKASWNLQNQKFYKGMQLKNWGIFIINTSNEDFQGPTDARLLELIKIFAESAGACGITVAERPTILGAKLDQTKLNNSRILQDFLLDKLKPALAARLSFLLVILSTGDKRIYGSIRRICDVELGISATCVQSQKIRSERGQPQYIANCCMKINAKLGGVNHALDSSSASWLSKELTMLVGMDVTHPGPGSIKGTPSIAGVVASYDSDFALYPASLKLQKTKQEMIEDLTDMMVERLLFFRQKRNALPKRIIVFRDGVSEGQFSTVLHQELSKILEAFKKVGGAGSSYKPKLTIIICGKRHHTRFYPTSEGSADQLGNPKPGTVVDRGVTAIFEFDFFLQAHSGLQGATRPTHYTVIYDQNKFDADAAQSLINYSSYIFARSTRALNNLVACVGLANEAVDMRIQASGSTTRALGPDHGEYETT
ncbi:hypothetical protein Clacol_008988 [Clathrus columnatus]|uniref:Piwi-domain-containing protein n=1 Tax=Clathrus columnatus TaxID=1419009 RepID=A0AAV5AQQ9_9AGAM|nr:hypothetical protein Clacol_008988 [Clathrus columnatus]